MRYAWAGLSDPGRVRDHNEDALFPIGDGTTTGAFTGAVADGMGGHVGGEIASGIAIDAAAGADHLTPAERVAAANLAVIDRVVEHPRLAGMGTTLTLVHADDDGTVRIAHVGDSRAYLLAEGALTQLTRDHSMVADMVAAGELTPDQAATHPYRSVITRAIGLERALRVDTADFRVAPGDLLLVCSDGLTSMLDDEAVAAIITTADGPPEAARALVDAANEAGGEDNITVLVVAAME